MLMDGQGERTRRVVAQQEGGNQRKIQPVGGRNEWTYNILMPVGRLPYALSGLSPDGLTSRFDRDQFLRQRKLHILFDDRQVFHLRRTVGLQIGDDLLD